MSERHKELSVNVSVSVPEVHQVIEDRAPYSTGLGYGLWCACLVGGFGLHRFYLGKTGTGVLWLLTAGLLGVGQVIDLVRMKSLIRDANIRDGRVPHPRQLALAQARTGAGDKSAMSSRPPSVRQQLLKAAMDNGGDLTVTQAVLATDLPFEEVEKALNKMSDKGYVDVDNAPGTGVVVYRFPELLSRSRSG